MAVGIAGACGYLNAANRNFGHDACVTDQRRVFAPGAVITRDEARRGGWTDAAIHHATRAGRWERLRRGCYRVRAEPAGSRHEVIRLDLIASATAAQHASPRAIMSHSPALAVHRLPTLWSASRPCLTVPAGTTLTDLNGAHLHRAQLSHSETVEVDGLPLTSIARTVADVAREHGTDAAVIAVDAALRAGRVARGQLDEVLRRQLGWPGCRSAARAFLLADPASESPLESLSRLRLLESGIPQPVLQQEIGDELGRLLARVDFYWDEYGVVGEADGRDKYRDLDDVIAEKERQSLLMELGLTVVRWTWADLRRFDAVASRLRSAFARGRRRGFGRGWSLLDEPRFVPGLWAR